MPYPVGTELIGVPWLREFLAAAKTAKSEIFISSPYIKESVVLRFLQETEKARQNGVIVRVLTSLDAMNFVRGASDLAALRAFHTKGIEVRAFSNLHAKVYLFDSKVAFVTSANLTGSGTSAQEGNTNLELGIRTDLRQVTEPLVKYLNNAWADAYCVHPKTLDDIEKVIEDNAKLIEKMKLLATEVGQKVRVKKPSRAPTMATPLTQQETITKAEWHISQGHTAAARKLVKTLPHNKPRSLRVIVQSFWNESKYEAAYKAYRSGFGHESKTLIFSDPTLHYEFSQRLRTEDDVKGALREFEKAKKASRDPLKHLEAGNRYRKTKKNRLVAYLALRESLQLFESAPKQNIKRIEEVREKLRLLDLNGDPELILMIMSRVGSVIADRIIKERKNGEFKSLEDFRQRVRGIGLKTIEINRDKLKPFESDRLFSIEE